MRYGWQISYFVDEEVDNRAMQRERQALVIADTLWSALSAWETSFHDYVSKKGTGHVMNMTIKRLDIIEGVAQ